MRYSRRSLQTKTNRSSIAFAGTLLLGIALAPAMAAATDPPTGSIDPMTTTTSTTVEPATATPGPTPAPHCEVPCGIFADQMRFQMMLEDTETIAKAIASVTEFASGLEGTPPTATSLNQATRWITTKEEHANHIQHVVAQYFLSQRIKPENKDYMGQLATAHRVMVAAMKCKQDANPATATALKTAIYDLYRAYEGKEPAFEVENK